MELDGKWNSMVWSRSYQQCLLFQIQPVGKISHWPWVFQYGTSFILSSIDMSHLLDQLSLNFWKILSCYWILSQDTSKWDSHMPERWLNIFMKLNGPVSDMSALLTAPLASKDVINIMFWWWCFEMVEGTLTVPGVHISVEWLFFSSKLWNPWSSLPAESASKAMAANKWLENGFGGGLDFLINMLILWLIINTYQLQYNTLLDEYNMVCGVPLWIWLQYNMAKNII